MTTATAWNQLLDLVEQQIPKEGIPLQPQFSWSSPDRLLLSGAYQVQATFVRTESRYEVRFEPFNAESNKDSAIASEASKLKRWVWNLEYVQTEGQDAWQLDNGIVLPTNNMVPRILNRLSDFYEEYRRVATSQDELEEFV
jgi:hypothetical protein